jgi:dihydrofolate synthase/folylpolyglutamate synthase
LDYLASLRFLQARDDWERTGSAADAERWDLRRMRSLLARLGGPHLGRKTVHIAGSKGKGSVAAMIASVLDQATGSVGLYTSPHLHRFVERIAVNGEPILQDDFGRLVEELAPHIEAEDADGSYGSLSTFEALTAMAFMYFRERNVDYQVLETGLGGRLDATNVFDTKDVVVLTPISLEHTAILGDTVPKIAEEKAGIITAGATMIMALQRESASDVFKRVCEERDAMLVSVAESCQLSRKSAKREEQEFALKTPRSTYKLKLPLLGRHQLDNAATAVLALEALLPELDEKTLRDGLAGVKWPCRVELLKQKPLIVADGAHNRDSMRRLVQTLRDDLNVREAVFVIGCARDKDMAAFVEELAPVATAIVATQSRNPRAKEPREIADTFREAGVPVAIETTVGAAVDAALAQSSGGAVVICGSLFVAAEAREHVLGVMYDPPLTEAKREVSV